MAVRLLNFGINENEKECKIHKRKINAICITEILIQKNSINSLKYFIFLKYADKKIIKGRYFEATAFVN